MLFVLHVLVYYLSFWILLNLDFSAADMIVYDGAGINTRLTVQWNCDHVIALILTVGGQISFFCIRLVLRSSDPGPGEG